MPAIPIVGGVAYSLAGSQQHRVRGDFEVQSNNAEIAEDAGRAEMIYTKPR